MDMLGHYNVGPQGELEAAAGRIEGLEEPAPCSVPTQERQPSKAGKRQFVSMAWFVVALVTPSMLGNHGGTTSGRSMLSRPYLVQAEEALPLVGRESMAHSLN